MGSKTNGHDQPVVPVYMFHSIARQPAKLAYGHLSTPLKSFIGIVAYLRKRRFNTVTLTELFNHLVNGETLPPKPIVITFDDGYLDNWVNGFPILARYRMKATIFVVPEFVDPRLELRPTLHDVWKRTLRLSDLAESGFLSWNEMRAMEMSGLIDIQSHSLTHTTYFQGDRIVDFHHPGDRYPWLAWNEYPERKHLWSREDQTGYVGFGTPIYTYGRALAAPQYFPNESLARVLQEYVKQHGGLNFFRDVDWRRQLFNVSRGAVNGSKLRGRYEEQGEYEARVRKELLHSKTMIESALSKKVNFLCWPGGACNDKTQWIAEEVGYLATTKGTSKNTWGADPRRIQRIGGEAAITRNRPRLDRYIAPLLFAVQVEAYRGSRVHGSILYYSLAAGRVLRSVFGPKKSNARNGLYESTAL